MRIAVITFIIILCAIMGAVAMHNEPDKNTVLVDARMPLQAAPPMLFSPCPLGSRNFRRYEERKA